MTPARIVALRCYQVCTNLLVDPVILARRVQELPTFIANVARYGRAQSKAPQSFHLRFRYLHPVLGDRHAGAGQASGHYFHQDIWAAQEIFRHNPSRHVDVGSSVAGFIAHLLCFREVEYVDLRPLRSSVRGLTFRQGDLTALPYPGDSLESLSALHVIEHVGLGRYGDPIDPEGWRLAVGELNRVLAPGGILYFSTPIGKERLEFDAHRVFAPTTIVDAFANLDLEEFSFVNDGGDLVRYANPAGFTGWYCCGLFKFKKPKRAA
jgi:SAM-dependent methyltransferase